MTRITRNSYADCLFFIFADYIVVWPIINSSRATKQAERRKVFESP